MKALTDYKIKSIKNPHGMYILSMAKRIEDEGNLYRLDNTYIYPKHKIKSIKEDSGKIILEMNDGQTVFEVED